MDNDKSLQFISRSNSFNKSIGVRSFNLTPYLQDRVENKRSFSSRLGEIKYYSFKYDYRCHHNISSMVKSPFTVKDSRTFLLPYDKSIKFKRSSSDGV